MKLVNTSSAHKTIAAETETTEGIMGIETTATVPSVAHTGHVLPSIATLVTGTTATGVPDTLLTQPPPNRTTNLMQILRID